MTAGTCAVMGTASTMAVHRRGARHDAARYGRDSRRPRRPAARGGGDGRLCRRPGADRRADAHATSSRAESIENALRVLLAISRLDQCGAST